MPPLWRRGAAQRVHEPFVVHLPPLPAPASTGTLVAVDEVRLVAFVRGDVQGVGFRWWTRSQALALGLTGYAKNLPDGRVEVQAQGSRDQVDKLLQRLEADDHVGRPGRVAGVTHHWLPVVDLGPRFSER